MNKDNIFQVVDTSEMVLVPKPVPSTMAAPHPYYSVSRKSHHLMSRVILYWSVFATIDNKEHHLYGYRTLVQSPARVK
jgi:hypothetical protein